MFSFQAEHRVFTGDGTAWEKDSSHVSLFDCSKLAIGSAEASLAWLARELAWPARDAPARRVAVGTDRYLRCPFCARVFSLSDRNRWGGGTHLSCGQRIDIVEKTP